MSDPVIAAIVREVLAEELARIRKEKGPGGTLRPAEQQSREIGVTIAGDADLQGLVRRVIAMTEDPVQHAQLKDGKIVFRLTGTTGSKGSSPPPPQAGAGSTERFEHGLLTERQVDRLAPQTKTVIIGKKVRTTPLARDRLRQRGISIERTEG